jgi:hypothetical protein
MAFVLAGTMVIRLLIRPFDRLRTAPVRFRTDEEKRC